MPIRAAFWCEGFGDILNRRAEVFEHVADHGIVADEEAVRLDLARCVAVADVPGETGKVVARDGEAGFGCSGDFDQAAIGKFKGIAVVEMGGLLHVDDDGETRLGRKFAAPEEPVFVGELQAVGGRFPLA